MKGNISASNVMKWFFAFGLMLLVVRPAIAQEEEECTDPTDKKIVKLLETADDKKKDKAERHKALMKAIEMDDQCLPCYMAAGRASYLRAKNGNGRITYGKAIEYYQRVIEICPDYHSDPYYYLGTMHYTQGNWEESAKFFQQFLDFTDGEPEKFSKKWEKMYADVEEIMPEIKFYADFYGNPVPFEPQMVVGVSSNWDDYLPMLTPDNELMFYTRRVTYKAKGDITGRQVEELTMSNRGNGGLSFSDGTKLPKPFNIGDNYGGITFSVDNKEMYVTICKPIKVNGSTYNNCDIYRSEYTMVNGAMQWTAPENLGNGVNQETSWESQPTLSGDGKTLFFSKVSADTKATDIYFTTRQSLNSSWGRAEPLTAINTDGNDKSPFIHSDSETLYFASDGRLGAGKLDIYYTKYENGAWTEPKNIGYPINTEEDEVGLFVSTDGRLAYYASSKHAGAKGYDVYAFELHKKARPEKIVVLKGQLKDEKGKVMQGATVSLKYESSDEPEEVKTDSVDGRYVAVVKLKKDEDVVMTIKKEGHAMQTKLITPESLGIDTSAAAEKPIPKPVKPPQRETQDVQTEDGGWITQAPSVTQESETPSEAVVSLDAIKVEKVRVGKPFRINDIKFNTGSATLTEQDKLILNEFAIYLKENPKMKISIQGHTDNVGNDANNLALSTERAYNVKEYLESKGIQGSRLKSKGFGETRPIGTNNTDEGRRLNRRTEFVVLSM